jgi:hypothetical protein
MRTKLLVLAGGIGLAGAATGAILGGFFYLWSGLAVFLGVLVYYFAEDEAVR